MAIDELLISYHFHKANGEYSVAIELEDEIKEKINNKEIDESFELHFFYKPHQFRK